MSSDFELLPCGECGMPCRAGEYHPFAACLMFKACHNSETVRANLAPLQAENERLLGEWLKALGLSMQAQAEAKDLRGACDVYQARAERLEKTLGAYQAAVNKIDDLIEYSLPMPPETKAALHAILADLTAALAQGGE